MRVKCGNSFMMFWPKQFPINLKHAFQQFFLFLMQDTEQHLQEHALLAEAMSPLGVRILSLDVDLARQLMVCGDRTGNVFAFFFDASCLERPGRHFICSSKHACLRLKICMHIMALELKPKCISMQRLDF